MAKPRESGWLPFLNGEPINADELGGLMGGDAPEVERTDGPAVVGVPAAGGGQRHINPVPDEDSDLERLEHFLTLDEVWEWIERFEDLHKKRQASLQLYGGRRRGAKRNYQLMDVLVIEVARFFFDNAHETLRNLRDPKTWKRLRKAVRRAFPKNGSKSHRRLSKTPPSRHQLYRARRDYFSGDALDQLRRWYRHTAVKFAKEMGLFDPAAGSWTHPDKTQSIVADMTWKGSATQYHRSSLFHPTTGKPRRFDYYADYHRNVDGVWTRIPGRELVMLSARTGHGNERILLDADFMPRKKCPSRKGRNEADFAIDMLRRLLSENPDELGGGAVKLFIFDMAMDAEGFDDVLNMRLLPMAKTPKKKNGKYRSGNLGPHEFTTRCGATVTYDLKSLNGSLWVMLPDGYGDEAGVPLRRKHLHWGAKGERSIAYLDVAIPKHARVLQHLQEATTTVRLNSTPKEINSNPHRRRTKWVRPIPEADPDFAIFGAREDIESTFSDLKHKTRGRLNSIREDFYQFSILAYMMLRLSRSVTAFRRRTRPAAPQPAPPTGPIPLRPRPGASGVSGPQRRSAATTPQAIPRAA